MVIAINLREVSGDTASAKYLSAIFSAIATANPSHQFYFISEKETVNTASANIHYVVLKQQSKSPLLWKLWYNYTLPSLLQKIKADALVSADGIASLRIKTPQCLFVNDLHFLHHPQWHSKKYIGFANAVLPASLAKAKSIIVFSECLKNGIISQYKTDAAKIETVPFVTDKNFLPQPIEANQATKDKYADGAEYFLCCCSIHERNYLTNLLKAFSLFKKRQKSSMKLLLATDSIPAKNTFVESLRLYKYRNDVKLLEINNQNEIHSLVAASWCCISLSPWHSDILFLQNALQCQVPVIAGSTEQAKELLKGAALYANPTAVETIAEQMMLVYKDEALCSQLVSEGEKLLATKAKQPEDLWRRIVSPAQK